MRTRINKGLWILSFLIGTHVWAQNPLTCNDTLFYRIVTKRPFPTFNCDTIFVITPRHYDKLFALKHQDKAVKESLNRELELYKEQQENFQKISARHQTYADSLDRFIQEKNLQLDSMSILAKRATANTDKALRIAKTNRALSIGSSVLSGILLLLLAFN